jgi:hypothetical protein
MNNYSYVRGYTKISSQSNGYVASNSNVSAAFAVLLCHIWHLSCPIWYRHGTGPHVPLHSSLPQLQHFNIPLVQKPAKMNPILKYHPQAIEDLHKTRLSSKTILDVAPDPRVEEQIHAADRAYLRAGIHKDGDYRHKMRGFHPMFHALRDSTKSRGDRKGWIRAVRDDMWDAVHVFYVNELPWLELTVSVGNST